MNWKIGDRVRMVQADEMTGTIAGLVKPGAGADGTDRIPVKWDRSRMTTEWNPGFLRPVTTRATDDPDTVICGEAKRQRGRVYIDRFGTTIVVPDGFSLVDAKAAT